MIKKIIFNVSVNVLFGRVIVFIPNGRVLLEKEVNQHNFEICVCAKCSKIAIEFQYGSRAQAQYFNLNNCPCHLFNIGFNLNNLEFNQNIILLDRNYNLPVKNAILNFSKKPNAS